MQLAGHTSVTDALGILCRAVYDPRADDAAFRLSLQGDAAQRCAAFDLVRKNYPVRREIPDLQVQIDAPTAALRQMIAALGMTL